MHHDRKCTAAVAALLLAGTTPAVGNTVRVILPGAETDSPSFHPVISADGRFIAFTSAAATLGGTNQKVGVFVQKLATGATERISLGPGGVEADGHCSTPTLSADGRFVAFVSEAGNLLPGKDTNGKYDVFVRNRSTDRTERVSVGPGGAEADSDSFDPAISADGRFIAFISYASNLVPGDTNKSGDVFVHDRATNTTERVRVTETGAAPDRPVFRLRAQANASSYDPAISADGRFVAFATAASNLVPRDTNEIADVFVYDRAVGKTERVSVGSGGEQALAYRNWWSVGSFEPAISADGRFIAFISYASNLVPGDTNGSADIFVHDRATGETERVNIAETTAPPPWPISLIVQANAPSYDPAISANGRFVAFATAASNLVPRDTNGTTDIFVRDRATNTTERVSVTETGAARDRPVFRLTVQANQYSTSPSISADGRIVAFVSTATNLVLGDTNMVQDIFVRHPYSVLTGPDE